MGKMLKEKLLQKKNIARLLFIVITVVSLWYWDGVMCVKNDHGINQAKAMYHQPRNSIDVVMMGSSHIHCDIDPGLLWKKYGIASFDYSAAEQPLWITYHYLIELCKYQKPKVVVLDLYSPAIRKDDYQYDWLKPNILGMRFSLNKLRMLSVSAEPDRWGQYFPSMAVYHDRFSEITAEDFAYPLSAHKEMETFKGFAPYFDRNPQEEPEVTENHSGGLTAKSEEYLQKIIKFTKDHNLELFLVVSPYIATNEDKLVFNRVNEIAQMNDIEFFNTIDYCDEMEIDFEKDFFDASHLNYYGAEKYTGYLGNELKKRFDIPDRRGDSKYDSWDANHKHVCEMAEKSS